MTREQLNKTDEYIVMIEGGNFNKGDILKLLKDDGSSSPFFQRIDGGYSTCTCIERLQPKKTLGIVGDNYSIF